MIIDSVDFNYLMEVHDKFAQKVAFMSTDDFLICIGSLIQTYYISLQDEPYTIEAFDAEIEKLKTMCKACYRDEYMQGLGNIEEELSEDEQYILEHSEEIAKQFFEKEEGE